MKEDAGVMYLRQQDIFDIKKKDTAITVVGAGSLGSWTVLGLAKLGLENISVYDNDEVALHNIPSQFFSMQDVPEDKSDDGDGETGTLKVLALQRNVRAFTDVSINPTGRKFIAQALSEVMVVTPDNMVTRKQVFLRCQGNTIVKRLIDGRMGGQNYRIYCVDPNNPEHVAYYLKNWYSDEQGSEVPCTAKGVGYNATMCAMEIVNLVKRTVMGQELPVEIVFDAGGLWRTVEWEAK